MNPPLFLPAMAVASCLGIGKAATIGPLMTGSRTGITGHAGYLPGRAIPLGCLPAPLPPLADRLAKWDSRNNRLLAVLTAEIEAEIDAAINRFGAHRIAVVIGTSTSGIAEGEAAIAHYLAAGQWPVGFDYHQQETGSGAAFLADLLGLSGPAYVVATACSSSAKALASARRLIRAGLADAAIVGGADTLCRMTVNGFAALESLAAEPCNPFSLHRNGITIGEGGALFVLSPDPAELAFAGLGEGSDAHHISAPAPDGRGALAAMDRALADADLDPAGIGYLNLHGTATPLNDSMEARAVAALFGERMPPCGSTKAMTGHCLGAAGAVEAAFLWLTLSRPWNPEGWLPPHRWDGTPDPALPALPLTMPGARLAGDGPAAALSNSFAFGGSNCCLAFRRGSAPR
jgi:3-oxoacyl-[acyl-carrier-protein] synthase-1